MRTRELDCSMHRGTSDVSVRRGCQWDVDASRQRQRSSQSARRFKIQTRIMFIDGCINEIGAMSVASRRCSVESDDDG